MTTLTKPVLGEKKHFFFLGGGGGGGGGGGVWRETGDFAKNQETPEFWGWGNRVIKKLAGS